MSNQTLNAIDHKTRPESLNQAKKLYKKVGIPQILIEEPCMTASILTKKKTQNQNQSIADLRIQNPEPRFEN